MDAYEIISQLQQDDALRAQLRAVLLSEDLLTVPERLATLERQITELTARVDQLAAAVADLTRQMTLLTGIVQRVVDGFDEILARLGTIEGRLS